MKIFNKRLIYRGIVVATFLIFGFYVVVGLHNYSVDQLPFIEHNENIDKVEIKKYTLTNKNGMKVEVLNLGGIVTSILVPDKNGVFENVVLGFDSIEKYQLKHPFFGALVGRYANRISNASFVLDGKEYQLVKNNNENHIHGGGKGFDKVIWEVTKFNKNGSEGLELQYFSPDGEEGYPGNLTTTVIYTLNNDNSLTYEFRAESDKKTVLNLTQHNYFNLSGHGDILNHELQLLSSNFLPINSEQIPTGEIRKVDNTPFDFKEFKKIGANINDVSEQLARGSGYDHFWILDDYKEGKESRLIAKLKDSLSGRVMEVYSTDKGAQIYTGNFLDGSMIGSNGKPMPKRAGICIEVSGFPDAPNKEMFPSSILLPGDQYYSKTTFKFLTE